MLRRAAPFATGRLIDISESADVFQSDLILEEPLPTNFRDVSDLHKHVISPKSTSEGGVRFVSLEYIISNININININHFFSFYPLKEFSFFFHLAGFVILKDQMGHIGANMHNHKKKKISKSINQ